MADVESRLEYLQAAAVRMIRRAQWFLMSFPIMDRRAFGSAELRASQGSSFMVGVGR